MGYPILTHVAIGQNEFELALLLLGIIAGLSLITRSKLPGKNPSIFFEMTLWIGMAIFAVCIILVDATRVTLDRKSVV